MKTLFFLIIAFISLKGFTQSKYLTKTGRINFEASVPAFEQVAAENNSATAIINTENGDFAVLVLVKGFRFKNALMEEHFNENYAESDKFPKATFKGTFKDFNWAQNNSNYLIDGELTFHGKTKTIENIRVSFSKENNHLILSGQFKVRASDFDIDIPKIVSNKIAETIEVFFNFELDKK